MAIQHDATTEAAMRLVNTCKGGECLNLYPADRIVTCDSCEEAVPYGKSDWKQLAAFVRKHADCRWAVSACS